MEGVFGQSRSTRPVQVLVIPDQSDWNYKLEELPGFLRCEASATVDGIVYRGIATAAFSPEEIQPTQKLPVDFWEFWNEAKTRATKVPTDVKLTHLPEVPGSPVPCIV